jgi:transcriptional regulator with XRE-family HTH domain
MPQLVRWPRHNVRVFRERLRQAMVAAGLSASELARRCDVDRQTVAQWLLMKEAKLNLKNSAKVADALGCELYWLATGRDEASAPRKPSK